MGILKAFGSKKYLWITPILILMAGIINLMSDANENLDIFWYVMIPIAAILAILGIKTHLQVSRKEKDQQISS